MGLPLAPLPPLFPRTPLPLLAARATGAEVSASTAVGPASADLRMPLLLWPEATPLPLLATCARGVGVFVPAAVGPVSQDLKTGLPPMLLLPLSDAAPLLLLAA
jgi:hypothetical protein